MLKHFLFYKMDDYLIIRAAVKFFDNTRGSLHAALWFQIGAGIVLYRLRSIPGVEARAFEHDVISGMYVAAGAVLGVIVAWFGLYLWFNGFQKRKNGGA